MNWFQRTLSFLGALLVLSIMETSASGIPASCKAQLKWAFKVVKQTKYHNLNQIKEKNMLKTCGVTITDATFEDFQRLFKCTNTHKRDCNDKGLQFPTTCSKPPCNTCDYTMPPKSCKPHLNWALKVTKQGKYQHLYQINKRNMLKTCGVTVTDATIKDFQRLFKCTNTHKIDCNDKGLQFPTTCSKPPCNTCDSTVPKSCKPHLNWAFKVVKQTRYHRLYQLRTRSMRKTCGVNVTEATFEDFQRLFKCANIHMKDCNKKGLQFPITCSKPPCNTCDYTMPKSCKPHLNWALKVAKQRKYQHLYQINKRNMLKTCGVTVIEATIKDFQRLFKCTNTQKIDCNDKGLKFPITCSKPPCNTCDSTVPKSCKPHLNWALTVGKQRNQGLYQIKERNMRKTCGVTVTDAKFEDFQRLFKCTNTQKVDCNDKGLQFPKTCSKLPCDTCPGN